MWISGIARRELGNCCIALGCNVYAVGLCGLSWLQVAFPQFLPEQLLLSFVAVAVWGFGLQASGFTLSHPKPKP